MGIFQKISGKKSPPKAAVTEAVVSENSPEPDNGWKKPPNWGALKDGISLETGDGPRRLTRVSCGNLRLSSGRLVVCDPFVFLEPNGMPYIETPCGAFPVYVTLADVSKEQNGSHMREAYASIVFEDGEESFRKELSFTVDGIASNASSNQLLISFPVDAGTACFVDESSLERCMPPAQTWYEDLFENERPDCWFMRMDDPKEIREGIANIVLPLAKEGENLILFHSGWGDGSYPVVGAFDSSNRLLAVHIDFLVIH